MDATRWAGFTPRGTGRRWSSGRPRVADPAEHGSPASGLALRSAGRAVATAVSAVMLLAGPLTAPHEARPTRPAGFAVPDPPAPGPAAPEADRSPAPPAEPPGTREPPSDAAPGPSRGPGVLQVPPPPEGAGVPAPGARYAWPLLPVPAIATRFRAPPHPYGRGHRGVDLVGAAGQPVLAARAGTVVFAGPVGARGVVSVAHDDGLRTTYEPVRPAVRPGVVVAAGDVLGLLEPGHPGCAAVACLHWGVRRGLREYLDPLVLLRPPEVRLLPVPDPWPAGILTAGTVTAGTVTARGPPGAALSPR